MTLARSSWLGILARSYGLVVAVVLALSLCAQLGAERDWLGRAVVLVLLGGLVCLAQPWRGWRRR